MQTARRAPLSGSRAPFLALVVAAVGLATDEITKALAVEHLSARAPVHVVGSLLQLSFTRNPGAAFSTGTSLTPVISVVAMVAAGVVLWFLPRTRSAVWAWALGLLLAGILGNLADRLFRPPRPMYGHVIDFIALPHWPIFNVADVCINIAAVLIVLQVVRGVRADGTRESDAGDGGDNSA